MGLFSTTHHHHNTEIISHGPSHVTVTEKKAPTEESVKLLNEFEEKARKNIIAKVHTVDNTINLIAIAYTDNRVTASQFGEVHIKFSINGKEYNITERFNLYEHYGEYKDEQALMAWLKDYSKVKVCTFIINDLGKIMLNKIKEY